MIIGPRNLQRQLERFAKAYEERFGRLPEDWPPHWLKACSVEGQD